MYFNVLAVSHHLAIFNFVPLFDEHGHCRRSSVALCLACVLGLFSEHRFLGWNSWELLSASAGNFRLLSQTSSYPIIVCYMY